MKKETIKIKVCGMNDMQNLQSLLMLDIDFVGFIFYSGSSRNCTLTPSKVTGLWKSLNIGIRKVGVFVDASLPVIVSKVEDFELDYIQLHGSESASFCTPLKEKGYKIIKAFSMDHEFDFEVLDEYKHCVDYFLFDTKGALPGGNGITYDWKILEKYLGEIPFFLSGGIDISHADKIIQLSHPMLNAVDINSRFEEKPGVKKYDLVKAFIDNLKSMNSMIQ